MRRALPILAVAAALLVVGLALPLRGWTQMPGTPVAAPGADPSQFSLGELMEGGAVSEQMDLNALPLETHHPLTSTLPAPEGYAVDFQHYPTADEINQFLDELERDYPTLAATRTLGQSWQGRPIRALRLANEAAPGALEDRPVMYVDGQHHARELVSNQVALYTAWRLLDSYGRDMFVTHLLDTRVLYVIPTVNPDGNDRALADDQWARRTANPTCCDDDFNLDNAWAPDGRFDEDYSVGYGYGTHDLYLYHFTPEWADDHPENPFEGDWQRHQVQPRESLGRYTGALGGPMNPIPRMDMDGDGLQDEDEIGGVDPNRNYDAHWNTGDPVSWSETYGGPDVWSEPEVRAIRDFALEVDHMATALAYHSGVDRILHPWGWSRDAELPEASTFELLGRKGSQLTEVNGFPGSPHTWTARGLYGAAGSTMDWLYESRGAYALSPEVFGGSSRTRLERLGSTGTYSVGTSIGFSYNPVPDEILATADRWHRFALYMLAATPNLELNDVAVVDGSLVLTMGNDGVLPVEVTVTAEGADGAPIESEVRALSAGSGQWVYPLNTLKLSGNHIRARAWLPVGTRPHEVELAEWVISVSGDQVTLDKGLLVPFPDLGAHFEGWWAPDEFDEPGRYHLPPGQPIPVTPWPTPTVGPSQTPRPTYTPTPIEPSATPTATSGPRPPGDMVLPWLYSNRR